MQNIYKLGKYVGNIFVYGDSYETYLVAIVVPDFEIIEPLIERDASLSHLKGKKPSEIIKDPKIIELIKQDMINQENAAKLTGFEKVKKFELMTEDFTPENGLLTASMKLKRNLCKIKFQDLISKMYQKQPKL